MATRAAVRWAGRPRRILRWLGASTLAAGVLYTALWCAGGPVAAGLQRASCAPLRVLDRFGHLLRELPSACEQGTFTPYDELPPLLERVIVFAEDQRFAFHPGVDPVAAARATYGNLRADRVTSGASTLSMQLARLLQPGRARPRGAWGKLLQAGRALALERRLSKPEIFTAYVNLAYYGAGAYGISAAAERYFAKAVAGLSAGELTLLAVLPRAPSAYDLRRHPERALRRRSQLLRRMVLAGVLPESQRRAIEAEAITLAPARDAAPAQAGHFVDWVLSQLTAAQRRAGGVLETTLDGPLQQRVETLVQRHGLQLSAADAIEAGVVVLDTRTSEVRAMVGSHDYSRAQINIVTRRRQLGSLLKPFVYALAIEAGESPDSVALDIADVPSAYRVRDAVGREAGPLSYRQALAGSYNLAAVHVLERTSVSALHARLRKGGIAQLPLAPAQYGVGLALGSARVRLLDVAAGYGFLVRAGRVLAPKAIRSLGSYRPPDAAEVTLFDPTVSAQVMDMLSDAAARHLRFGRGLPVDGPDAAALVLKTGTASGLSDMSAVVASNELIVAAWSGRFDGAPTAGLSGMWAALPLAQRVLASALEGRPATLPKAISRSVSASSFVSAAVSGSVSAPVLPAQSTWPERARAFGPHGSRFSR